VYNYFANAVALRNLQNVLIASHVALIVTPSILSGSCAINIAAKTVSSGGIFDYTAIPPGDQGKVIFTNYIGTCVLRLIATFASTAGTVTAGDSCTVSNPSDETRLLIAHSVIPDPAFLLAAGPLTAGASYPFKREALLDSVFSSKPPPPRLRRTHFHESRAAHVSI